MKTIHIGVPSGIGDISWIISKLINAPDCKFVVEVADGWPYRSEDYVKLLDPQKFEWGGYGGFEYRDIVGFEKLNPYNSFKDIVDAGFGRYLIQPNFHLERGKALAEWLPDLPTSYQYPLNTKEFAGTALARIKHIPRPILGLSAASYRGAVAWKTWERDQWKELIARVLKNTNMQVLLMGGGWDDLTRSLENIHPRVFSVVGQTSFGEAVEIHKSLSGYLGFSSGLGIIRTVLGLPTYMLWPDHQQALSTSWADPQMISEGSYIATSYMDVMGVWNVLKGQIVKYHSNCGGEHV